MVVVSYNAREVTLRCLEALSRTDWPADRLEVVLVDNASSDGLVGEVEASHPAVRVISSTENQGFGRACNRGLEGLGSVDHVALINNDAMVDPGWLRPLVDALAADPGLGAVCPKVLLDRPAESHAVINSVGGVLFEGWFGGDRGYLEPDRGQYDEPAEVFSWSGAAVLLRAAYLRDVGHFNPAFFLYYEDFELSVAREAERMAVSHGSHQRGVASPRPHDRHRERAVRGLAGQQPVDDPGGAGAVAGRGPRSARAVFDGLSHGVRDAQALTGLWTMLRCRWRLRRDADTRERRRGVDATATEEVVISRVFRR